MASLLTTAARLLRRTDQPGSRGAQLRRASRRYIHSKQLRRARYPWNSLTHAARWSLGNRESLSRWTDARLGLEDYSWIFIVGCNNSGTTLLNEILSSHPLIRSLPREGSILTNALPMAKRLGVPRLFGHRLDLFHWTEEHDPDPALRAKYDWARYFSLGTGHLLEKSPEDTVRTRWLQRNFNPSRFIAVIRSPYAVCEGTRRRSGHTIERAAIHWTRINERLFLDLRHIQNQMRVHYEELCEHPERVLEQIQHHLELEAPFSAVPLNRLSAHNMDGQPAPIQNFNAKSESRLQKDEIRTITRIAGPLMEELGYERL